MKPYFNKITILGVGLIGASFAMALRKNALSGNIAGYGRKEANLKRAKRKGVIDTYNLDPKKACEGADLIVLATPVGTFKDLLRRIAPSLKKGAIVIDVGSVKGFVRELDDLMPEGIKFIGCHPIAGSNLSGIDAADSGLFRGALLIITKTEKTNINALRKVTSAWRAFGATIKIMTPDEHDKVYGLLSHMPHLIAYALVNTVADIDKSSLKFSGQGFKDTTRIASSSPRMWRDIVMLNKENLLRYIDVFKSNLDRLAEYLKDGDSAGIEKELRRAKKLREALKKGIGKD